LEGLVAKKRSLRYESGKRSGAWQKMRVHRSQDFVIGGYTLGALAWLCPTCQTPLIVVERLTAVQIA